MADCTLVVQLRNFEGRILKDVPTRLRFQRQKPEASHSVKRRFESGKERFGIPAFPLAEWDCQITAERYEIRNTGFFRPKEGERIEREVWLPRNVKAAWATQFTKWADLTGKFAALRKLLENSPDLKLTIRNKPSRPIGSFTGNRYDNVDDTQLILGKAGLLNMYAKLLATEAPGTPGSPWLSGIQQLLGIQRDRIVGIVSHSMAKQVRQIHENLPLFPTYRHASTGEHFDKNIKPLIPAGFSGKKVYSVKTREPIGVLQLVIAEVEYAQKATAFFVDADIDENGNLLKHFGDFIGHQFNGGTHPFHVYDLLHRTLKTAALAYELT